MRTTSLAAPERHAVRDRVSPLTWTRSLLKLPAITLVAGAVLAGCGGGNKTLPEPEPQASAESLCNGFLGRTIEGASITKVSFVPTEGDVPEHCVVRGEMPQDLDFEVRMPSDWNKRTVFIGGGGFDGSLSTPASRSYSPNLAQGGYVTIASNHGHTGTPLDGSFALDEAMLEDYAYRSVPRTMVPAKAILQQRYGEAFSGTKLVYEGCSGGGRQALIQAQRHPDLFDGIVSRAPANAYTPQFLWYQQVEKQLAQPGAALSEAKAKTVADAVMAKCDALDGLADGIIARPAACTFDPVELACTGAESDACLTPAQVQSARTLYAPTDVAGGRYTWPGFPVGGEFAWSAGAGRTALGSGYMKYMVTKDPAIDWLTVDPTHYTSRIDQLVTLIDAVDPDLGRFKARGGKLLLWTGLTDWLITANNATDYYQKVVAANGGQAAANEFVEYYTSPGVQHCSGGTGADRVDLVGPMFDWLEKGTKPSSAPIVASQWAPAAGTSGFKRPVCQYPAYPKYTGGDPNAADSFTCSTT